MLSNERIFSIPNFKRIAAIATWGFLSTIAFTVIYGLCNKLAHQSVVHYSMYLDVEKKIPLIPWMIYPYISLNILFIFAAFVLDNPHHIKGLCLSLILGVFLAGFIFYLFPGQLGFVRENVPGYEHYFNFMFSIDQPHNLFPSLHITYSSLTIWMMRREKKSLWFKHLLDLWLFLITLSVVFVHQHHLFDIVTGFILSYFIYRFYSLKFFREP